MADVFHCPHCQASYPIKPVLVGRPVRCTACKNVFILREDGHADKAPSPAPSTASAASSADKPTQNSSVKGSSVKSTPAKSAATENAATENAATKSPAPSPSKSTHPVRSQTETSAGPSDPRRTSSDSAGQSSATARATAQPAESQADTQETTQRRSAKAAALRRTMSSTLNSAAEAALASNAVKRETVKETRRSTTMSRPNSGETTTIGPAVLTNDGQREASHRRTNVLIVCGILVLIGGCSWLMLGRSPQQAALDAVIAPPEDMSTWLPPHRISTMQGRAWLPESSMPVAMNLDQARLGSRRRLAWGAAAGTYLQEQLDGCSTIMLGERLHWVPTAQVSAISQTVSQLEAAWERDRRRSDPVTIPRQQLVAAAREIAAHPVPSKQDIIKGLEGHGVTAPSADLLLAIMTHPSDMAVQLRDKITQSGLPSAIEIQEFSLRKPEMLFMSGGAYISHVGGQGRGRLMRFSDNWWPTPHDGWRLLDFQLASGSGNYESRPGDS